MAKQPTGKRASLKQTRAAIHRTLDDIRELDGAIADEYIEWVVDTLSEPDDPIRKLFERAGLDSEEPKHWIALLSYIVEVIYTERRGSPVVWTEKREHQLIKAAYQMKLAAKRRGQKITNAQICEGLLKNDQFRFLKTGVHKHSVRSARTLPGALERSLTRLEDEFVYPARRKDLERVPKIRRQYELWLEALRPAWRSRITSGKKQRSRKTSEK